MERERVARRTTSRRSTMRSTSSRWIPEDHPLRAVKQRADEVLGSMRKEFDGAYSRMGRPSIPPEMLLKALLLQALHSIRSERQLVEQMKMNLLYRWFIDLSLAAPVWDPTSFTKNRERFEQHGLLRAFFDRVVESTYVEEWASSDHFTVDGTLIKSYASMKSQVASWRGARVVRRPGVLERAGPAELRGSQHSVPDESSRP